MSAVFVLGMHRSGTSAVARMVNLMGISLGPSEHLIPPAPDNPKGFWENRTFMGVNDRLLNLFGGHWYSPPDWPADWVSRPEVKSIREQTEAYLAANFPFSGWGCKDPRLCLTFPFWRALAPPGIVAIYVDRAPTEIAQSLAKRNGFPTEASLGLWEMYTRSILIHLDRLPVAFVRFDELMSEPKSVARFLQAFLSNHGIEAIRPIESDVLAKLVDPSLRHNQRPLAGDAARRVLTPEQAELADCVAQLPLECDRFFAPPISKTPSAMGAFAVRLWAHGYPKLFRQELTLGRLKRVVDDADPTKAAEVLQKLRDILK